MRPLPRICYHALVTALRAYRRLFLDVTVVGRERIPPGPKIYVTNHVASTDPYWVLPVFTEPVHVIIGPGYQSRVMGWVLDRFGQINAMPAHRHRVVDESIDRLRRGGSVYTAPEGDIQHPVTMGRFYPGVAKIYRRFPVPIVPIALLAPRESLRAIPRLDMTVEGRVYRGVFVLRGPLRIHVGEPLRPVARDDVDEKDDNERIMGEIKERMRGLLSDIRRETGWWPDHEAAVADPHRAASMSS